MTMHDRRSTHASLVLTLLAAICVAAPAAAQARCDEATVRRLAAVSVTELASPDLYFNVQTGLPPVIGLAQLEALRVKHANERKNERPHVFTILQVVASNDASMAYDDGSVHVEFDDAKSGKHVAYDLSYLRAWRVEGGKCVTAAMYGRRGQG
jgi:ketosteroid isomerase-like protein